MIIKDGDILQCAENIIVHQVNCLGVMGSGLAKQIKDSYPEVYKVYYQFCKTQLAETLLGECLVCEVGTDKYIANLFGQLNYGRDKVHTDYTALSRALNDLADFAQEKGLTVAIPYKLGCGLAGGDWDTVSALIDGILPNAVIYKI